MAITRQVITSLSRDGHDMLGITNIAAKIIDESIVSGSLLTVESNHFCILKSRGAVLNVYETGQYALVTPDKPLVGSIVQGFFGGNSPWVYEVIYINRSKLLVSNKGIATSAEMAEVAYQVDYYVHVDTKEAALDLITHMPFTGQFIDTRELADYAGPAIEQAINQVVQVTKLENINAHISDLRESVKSHLTDFLKVYGILLNDLKVLILPKDDRMRELLSLQALGLTPIEAVRYYLAFKMAEKGLVSAPNAAVGMPFQIGGPPPVIDDLEKIAVNLFYGWGYNFYRLENQLRSDDLTVRAKIGGLLGLARASIDRAESAYRMERLPPPSREKPRPDADAVAGAQTLERMSKEIGALEGRVRAQPAPENDRMTQRYRHEAETLQHLLNCDMALAGRAEMLRAMLDQRDGAWMIEKSAEIQAGLRSIEAALRDRQMALAA